ncbi:DUF3703 domain-containing protein [Bowmanella dokdonensis]|uniref:DUF3703 domain-containing protein n=1 Tax=Bowmanella dokdonensis TaxID=751969 RepID=A0A939DNU7_9ALTE|nr:DUF3703 domain-containing protein [Bowmanella dokdonensis]MBN7825550.1 DUF3703 domain-containing protein [Bowmanella dokdonensis]
MTPARREGFEKQWQQMLEAFAQQNWQTAFYHLENAHVLGQPSTRLHVRSHWWMLKVAWCQGNSREVVGQWLRITAALLFSRIWVPVGNTGGANVSAIKPMPVRDELKVYLQ